MKYLVAVIECNSFTKAAEQCYISQSAVSQQIRALENELGVELIHRENRGFSVTAAGEYFYAQCRSVLDQLETIVRETKRLGKGAELQLPIYNGEKQIVRNYCVFWQKEKTNDYMIAFARVMQELLCHNDPADQNVNRWRV